MRKKKILRIFIKLDKILMDSIVEFKEPKKDGQLGTVLGVPIYESKE